MRAGFSQLAAFDQDATDNQAFLRRGKLTMPVPAVGGEKSFGPTMAVVMRAAATGVQEQIIPASGHWLTEEQPVVAVAAVRTFFDRHADDPSPHHRVTAPAMNWAASATGPPPNGVAMPECHPNKKSVFGCRPERYFCIEGMPSFGQTFYPNGTRTLLARSGRS